MFRFDGDLLCVVVIRAHCNIQCPSIIKTTPFAEGSLYVSFYSQTYKCFGSRHQDGENEFYMLSTVTPPVSHVSMRRKSGEQNKVARDLGLVVHLQNQLQHGVDINDQMRSMYTTKRRDAKWSNSIFSWVVDRAALNAYVCNREFDYEGTHEDWLLELVDDILSHHATDECRKRSSKHNPVCTAINAGLPERGRCAVCGALVNQYCTLCQKFYCIMARNCFSEFHDELR